MSASYGKFRALVTDISDPEKKGRIKVKCPRIYGDYESPWCLPCSPLSLDNGGIFSVPPIGEMVWVEFEEGDPNLPIYVGGIWADNESPNSSTVYPSEIDKHILIQTKAGHTIDICDKENKKYIKIEDSKGSSIFFNSETGDVTITANRDLITVAGRTHRSNAPEVHHN